MLLFFRVLRILLKNIFSRRHAVLDESKLGLRVWPTDMDLNFHLNDGRYISLAGLGRIDLMLGTGLLRRAMKRGWYPVVGAGMIRYRRELKSLEKFSLRSRVVGWDDKWIYFEHRFEKSGGDLAAIAYARGVLRNREGAIPTLDVMALVGHTEPSPPLPDFVGKFL
ncbi:MAG: thioesterase family protein [Acidobacteriota bacterium]|nr:thioesterase family protein [Acidobacteriota bacterium]